MKEELEKLNALQAWTYILNKKYLPIIMKCDGKIWNTKDNIPLREDITYPYNIKGIVMYDIEDYKVRNIEIVEFDKSSELYLSGPFITASKKTHPGRCYFKGMYEAEKLIKEN